MLTRVNTHLHIRASVNSNRMKFETHPRSFHRFYIIFASQVILRYQLIPYFFHSIAPDILFSLSSRTIFILQSVCHISLYFSCKFSHLANIAPFFHLRRYFYFYFYVFFDFLCLRQFPFLLLLKLNSCRVPFSSSPS